MPLFHLIMIYCMFNMTHKQLKIMIEVNHGKNV